MSADARSSPHRRGAPEASAAPRFEDVLAVMPLSDAERRDLEGEIAKNRALAASLRGPRVPKRPERPARPLTRYWKRISEAKPPGTTCKGCRKALPHSTYDERRACFIASIMRKKATGAWAKRPIEKRRAILAPATHAHVQAKLEYRLNQLRMWLAPQTLRVMGDKELKEIVLMYYASPSTRFYEWLRARYPVTDACPRSHNSR